MQRGALNRRYFSFLIRYWSLGFLLKHEREEDKFFEIRLSWFLKDATVIHSATVVKTIQELKFTRRRRNVFSIVLEYQAFNCYFVLRNCNAVFSRFL